jgi:hypothetical protein
MSHQKLFFYKKKIIFLLKKPVGGRFTIISQTRQLCKTIFKIYLSHMHTDTQVPIC